MGRPSVLMVEDDSVTGELYRYGLEAAGFAVTVLRDAVKLNEVVIAETPNVLVLDWDLPGVKGDEALDRLRATDAGRDLTVFMLSNHTDERVMKRVREAGAIAWLPKWDTTPIQLGRRLREVVFLND